ncbi:molybdate ABC transporter substrate-binding protein [Nocardioides sp.]|uniref:molybdate ABC transporter substrate-binding protein n=1 Tax=Nocardioides sp. TaxID=35761 RepID=UPI00238A55AB|nr:molybdate ABC transporter substrate-binding protein [Nocardioides sp.]MDE0777507.1 molybdate ABC transporter substrate-binding protein [Nocardioides sp.]
MRRRAAFALVLVVLAGGMTSCGDDAASTDAGAELTVLAAASLTETFTELATAFEEANPGVDVRLAFDSSATLAGQAVQGAPADVLATADTSTMQAAVDGDAVPDGPTTFATNVMTLVVPAGNPAGITSFADLDRPGVDYVVCVATAPCGKVGASLLAANEIGSDPASLETDVKAVLAKVAADEADAGLVYVTDATAAGDDVESIEIPQADSQVLQYPIGILEQVREPALAQGFVALVLSDRGRAILADAGFGTP